MFGEASSSRLNPYKVEQTQDTQTDFLNVAPLFIIKIECHGQLELPYYNYNNIRKKNFECYYIYLYSL